MGNVLMGMFVAFGVFMIGSVFIAAFVANPLGTSVFISILCIGGAVGYFLGK